MIIVTRKLIEDLVLKPGGSIGDKDFINTQPKNNITLPKNSEISFELTSNKIIIHYVLNNRKKKHIVSKVFKEKINQRLEKPLPL